MPLHGFIQVDGKKEPVDSDHIEVSLGVAPSVAPREGPGPSEPTTVNSSFSIKDGVLVTTLTIRNGPGGGQTTTTTTTDTNDHTSTTTTTTTDSSGNTHSSIEINQK